mmetsp:Transcript_18515/g.34301  ORF Transcript_18515/g.34301 Transcript_18515/m.34301 type:complete len:389 (+) Transcript_18515:149-1315(+)
MRGMMRLAVVGLAAVKARRLETELVKQVEAPGDDVEELSLGSVLRESSDLDFGGLVDAIGLRFTGLEVPRGAVVTSAKVQFTASDSESRRAPLFRIAGHDTGNAGVLDGELSVSGPPKTPDEIEWELPAFRLSSKYTTPELGKIIGHIVSRDDWQPGNAINIVFTRDRSVDSTDRREAFSFDGAPSANDRPTLQLTFEASTQVTLEPTTPQPTTLQPTTLRPTIPPTTLRPPVSSQPSAAPTRSPAFSDGATFSPTTDSNGNYPTVALADSDAPEPPRDIIPFIIAGAVAVLLLCAIIAVIVARRHRKKDIPPSHAVSFPRNPSSTSSSYVVTAQSHPSHVPRQRQAPPLPPRRGSNRKGSGSQMSPPLDFVFDMEDRGYGRPPGMSV